MCLQADMYDACNYQVEFFPCGSKADYKQMSQCMTLDFYDTRGAAVKSIDVNTLESVQNVKIIQHQSSGLKFPAWSLTKTTTR